MNKINAVLFSDKENKSSYYSYIYFHGKLEDDLGYDIVSEKETCLLKIEIDSLNLSDTKTLELKVLVGTETKDAIIYLWKVSKPFERVLGLVCYKDDLEANKDALEKQTSLKEII